MVVVRGKARMPPNLGVLGRSLGGCGGWWRVVEEVEWEGWVM